MPRRHQALIGIAGIAGCENLVAQGEIGSQTAGQIGADARPSAARRIDEDWTVADVLIRRPTALIAIINLWQAPDVVIADIIVPTRSHRHLIVESLVAVAPHLLQPVETELRF